MSAAASTPEQPVPEQKRAILAAALEILGRDGADALTVRNITTAAGCSTSGVYTWFGGKHGLVEAIFREGFDDFDRSLDGAFEAGDLVGVGRAFRRWARENPTQYLVMFAEAVPGFVAGDDALARAYAVFERLIDAVGRAAPHVRDEAATWAYHLNATVHGYVMLEIAGLAPAAPDQLDDLFEAGLQRVVGSIDRAR